VNKDIFKVFLETAPDRGSLFEGSRIETLTWINGYTENKFIKIRNSRTGQLFTASEFVSRYEPEEREPVSEFVKKYYRMNPETEDLLFDGTHLKNGMKVLCANYHSRIDFEGGEEEKRRLTPIQQEVLFRNHRWFTISHLKEEGDNIMFVATYDDGTKSKQIVKIVHAWYVKKDSIPMVDGRDSAKLDEVGDVVREAIQLWTSAWPWASNRVDGIVDSSSKKIYDLFQNDAK
jgi:hypothetical protein